MVTEFMDMGSLYDLLHNLVGVCGRKERRRVFALVRFRSIYRVCVCAYMCMHVCIYVCIYVFMNVYVQYTHTHTHTHTHIIVCVCVLLCDEGM
jgi:hypothetical protein